MPTIPEADHGRKLQWLKVADLKVDHSFQRPLNLTRVKHIAKNFDPDSFGSIEVSRRDDGDLIVLDGQHRVAVMYELRYEDQKVPALVHQGLTLADEARIFAVKNGEARRPSRVDIFRAEVVAGKPESVATEAVLASRQLVISHSIGTNHVLAVGAVERVAKETGLNHLGKTLDVLIEAWGRDSAAFQHDAIVGVALFMWRNYDHDTKRLAKALAGITPQQLLAQARSLKVAHAAGSGFAWNVGVPQIVTMLYNKGKRSDKFDSWEIRAAKAIWYREPVADAVSKVPAMAKIGVK